MTISFINIATYLSIKIQNLTAHDFIYQFTMFELVNPNLAKYYHILKAKELARAGARTLDR